MDRFLEHTIVISCTIVCFVLIKLLLTRPYRILIINKTINIIDIKQAFKQKLSTIIAGNFLFNCTKIDFFY